MLAQDAGKGVSSRAEDKFYPLITILQRLSPQVDEDNPAYLEGAKAGTIWLRNFETPLVPGQEGVVAQVAHQHVEYITWRPREAGGGMVGRSLKVPPGTRVVDSATSKMVDRDGNDVRETRVLAVNLYHNGAVVPFILPCQGTMNTFARQLNTVLDQKFEDDGTKSASWRWLWRLKTRERVSPKGRWYTMYFEQERKAEMPGEYLKGRELWRAVSGALEKGEQISEAYDEGEDRDAM
jgi:hypothetical protein